VNSLIERISPLDVVADVVLPRTNAVLPRVEAVRDHYLCRTGKALDWQLAIWCLDRLNSGRKG
jgi:hypothetical protein